MAKIKAGELVIEALRAEGVDHTFGTRSSSRGGCLLLKAKTNAGVLTIIF